MIQANKQENTDEKLVPALVRRLNLKNIIIGRWKQVDDGAVTRFYSKSPLLGICIALVLMLSINLYWWELPWPWVLTPLIIVVLLGVGYGRAIVISPNGVSVNTCWLGWSVKKTDFSLDVIIGAPVEFEDVGEEVLSIESTEKYQLHSEASFRVRPMQTEWLIRSVKEALARAREAKKIGQEKR